MTDREKLVELRALINACAASKQSTSRRGFGEPLADSQHYLIPRGAFDQLAKAAALPIYDETS